MKNRLVFISIFVSSLLVSLGIFFGLWFVSDGISNRAMQGLTVTGSAQMDEVADTAVWSIYVNTQLPTIEASVKKVESDTKAIIEYLASQGIASSEITTGGVSTATAFEFVNGAQTSNIIGYTASNNIKVRSKEVQKVKSAAENIGNVLQTGISASTGAPEYYLSDLASIRPKVIAEAVKDARQRAEAMVSSLGGEIGNPITGSSGSVQVNPPDSIESEYGSYDTSTIEKSVRAVITITFEVN